MIDIVQQFNGIDLNDMSDNNAHSNITIQLPFFDCDALVECCGNRYFYTEHTNLYNWCTPHCCDQPLAYKVRSWLEGKLANRRDNTIPILGSPQQSIANEIRDIIEDRCILCNFDKVQVNLRAGHVFDLFRVVDDGSIEMTLEEAGFSQQWPLCADVVIYAQKATVPASTCQVFITVGKLDQSHPCVLLDEITTTPRDEFGGVGGIAVA